MFLSVLTESLSDFMLFFFLKKQTKTANTNLYFVPQKEDHRDPCPEDEPAEPVPTANAPLPTPPAFPFHAVCILPTNSFSLPGK